MVARDGIEPPTRRLSAGLGGLKKVYQIGLSVGLEFTTNPSSVEKIIHAYSQLLE
jgi:hypothetical protein